MSFIITVNSDFICIHCGHLNKYLSTISSDTESIYEDLQCSKCGSREKRVIIFEWETIKKLKKVKMYD